MADSAIIFASVKALVDNRGRAQDPRQIAAVPGWGWTRETMFPIRVVRAQPESPHHGVT
jgi:hypothetical protein